MISTPLPVLDSAEWAFNEYEGDILGDTDSTDDVDFLREIGTEMFAVRLTLYWMERGREVKLVSAREYGRRTWNDEAINATTSSYELPDADDALAVWAEVAKGLTADDVRHIAGVA